MWCPVPVSPEDSSKAKTKKLLDCKFFFFLQHDLYDGQTQANLVAFVYPSHSVSIFDPQHIEVAIPLLQFISPIKVYDTSLTANH